MKQRHAAKRIFERLKIECGYTGGYAMVMEVVRTWKDATKEVFVPLSHPPGEAQVDFGFACVDAAGERQVTEEFQRLQSHSLFETQFSLVRRANEKGHVDGLVDFGRANFLVPVPKVASLVELNETLEERCREDAGRRWWGKGGRKAIRSSFGCCSFSRRRVSRRTLLPRQPDAPEAHARSAD